MAVSNRINLRMEAAVVADEQVLGAVALLRRQDLLKHAGRRSGSAAAPMDRLLQSVGLRLTHGGGFR